MEKVSFSCAYICACVCISHVWTDARQTQMQTQGYCVARVSPALMQFTLQVRYSLASNVNTPFFIIYTIIGIRHQSPSTKSRPCTPALNPLQSKIKIWILTCCPLFYFLHYKSSGEKLIKYQANSSCVIMSVIRMTTLFYKALIIYYKEKFDADHSWGLKG